LFVLAKAFSMQLACDFAQFLLCKKRDPFWDLYENQAAFEATTRVRIAPSAFDFLYPLR
jgi:hypothetical protein